MRRRIKKLRKFWKGVILNYIGYYSFFSKKNILPKDTQLCEIIKQPAKIIVPGNKIITIRGFGSIISVKNDWLVIGLGKSNNNIIEHKQKTVQQFFAKFKTITGYYIYYPLRFAHYKYMDQSLEIELAEIKITNKKYAQLTDKEIQKREYIQFFNGNSRGKDILKKLREKHFIIIKSN